MRERSQIMFAENLKQLRKDKNLTQTELADLFGYSHVAVVKWENGTREPDFATLIKLADYFEVTTDYLLGRKKEIQPTNFAQAVPNIEEIPQIESNSVVDVKKNRKINIINAIIGVMKLKKLSIKELSIQSGISQSTISSWIRGETLPTSYELKVLSLILDVSADYLLAHTQSITTLTEVQDKDHFIMQHPDYELVSKFADKYGLILADKDFENVTKLFSATLSVSTNKAIEDRRDMLCVCIGVMQKAGYHTEQILND